MEQDKFYLRVGIFISVLVAAAVYIISTFAVHGHREDYTTYAIYFKGSVDGLGLGSQVRLKGITVGNVKAISFALQEDNSILVLVNILKDAPIRNDTVATVQLLGITGTSYISLSDTGADPVPKFRKPGEQYPVIASIPSSLEKVVNNIPDLIEEMKKLSERGQALLSDENIAAINSTLKSIDATAKSIDGSAKALQSLLGPGNSQTAASVMLQLNEALVEARLAMREIRMLARTIREDPSVIIHGVQHEGKQLP